MCKHASFLTSVYRVSQWEEICSTTMFKIFGLTVGVLWGTCGNVSWLGLSCDSDPDCVWCNQTCDFPSTSQLQGQIYIGRKGSVGRSTSTWVLREMQKQKEGKLNIDFLVQSHWVVVQGKNKLYIHALRYTNHRQFRLISNTVSLVPHKLIWGTVAWPYFQMECTWLCSGTMKTKEALGLPASWGSMA